MFEEESSFRRYRAAARAGSWAVLRGVVLFGLAVVELLLFIAVLVSGSLVGVGLGVLLLPLVMIAVRSVTNTQRRWARRWSGVVIEVPYMPAKGELRAWRRCHWLLGDRATWRDALWLLIDPTLAVWLALTPALVMLNGLRGLAMPFLWSPQNNGWLGKWYLFLPVADNTSAWLAALIGAAHLPVALWVAPHLLRLHARLTALFLAPTQNTRLAHRVAELTETRLDTITDQHSELRRIQRDLHDGAQVRLVAIGMTLDAAGRVLDEDLEATRTLLLDAKHSSAMALQELRGLVRGIQPPILVDRGIADGIRMLAMENPLQIDVRIELPGRPAPAVESAAYFAVSEALNNAMKHSGSATGRINAYRRGNCLVIEVTDFGVGGADPASGTGLRGVSRRLAALDGSISVASPPGGPTLVAIAIPCLFTTGEDEAPLR